jgi:NTE family protein
LLINLVLSGGGVRGFAHLGIIKALKEHDIKINAVSGTSSGAVVGAFVAAGYSPDETLQIMKEYKLFQLLKGAFNTGIFSMNKFEAIYRRYFPDNSFEKLNFPLYISSTDLYSGTTVFFNQGELIEPLLASSSIPVLFKPVKQDGRMLLDGGLLNNLPVEPFAESKIPLIGVHVNPVGPIDNLSSTIRIMERSLHLAVYANIIERMKKCTLVLEPEKLVGVSVYTYSKANTVFDIGYNYMLEKMSEIKKTLGFNM